MKSFFYFFFTLIFISPLVTNAQMINDCATAQVVCSDEDLAFNPDGAGMNDFADPDNDEGCITALEQNSAWYYFEIDPAAPPDLVLGFIIHPKGGLGEDYDWALYGPDVECGDLGSPIRCSSSSAACDFCPETGMGMNTMDFTEGPGTGDGFVSTLIVQPGQGFYLLIDNWAGTTNGFVLTWTDTAAEYLNCEASPPCALYAVAGPDIVLCEGETGATLDGGSTGNHGNETYTWSGSDNGTDYLSDPSAVNPTITLPSGFTGTIIYTLTVVEDTCMNEDQMVLTVNPLPVINITQIGPFCDNSPVQALSATPSGGTWGGDNNGNTFNPMTNGPGIHTVTYTYSDGNDCTSTDAIDIEVFESPDVSIDPDPAEFCQSEGSILLTATGSDGTGVYTYNWNTPTGMLGGETYDATVSGLHTVVVTDENGCTSTAAISVIAHPTPIIQINDPGAICDNVAAMTLTATPSGGIFSGTIISPDGEFFPNSIAPGTYSVTYTYEDIYNCVGVGNLDITITETPNAIPSNNGPLCAGQQVFLYGATDGAGSSVSYDWIGPNGYSSGVQNPTDATLGGTYGLQVTIDGCASEVEYMDVELTTMPDATASNDGPYCNGQPIQLFGTTATTGNNITYAWTGPNGYTSNMQNPIDATDAGVYSLVITVDNCASAVALTEVVFSAAPDAAAANSGPYCPGSSIELFGSTTSTGSNISYAWTGPNGYVSNLQNPTNAIQEGQYQLIVVIDGCNSVTASTQVVFNVSPQPVITGENAFCIGNSATIDAGPGYANYLWSDASQNQTLDVTVAGTYHVTVTDASGCTGDTSFVVSETASLSPVITGALAFCEGSATTLDAGGGFASYAWSTGETGQTIQVTNGGNFGVIVMDDDGCSGSANVTTTENANPDVVIGGSTTYCIGGFTVLDAGAGYASYTWSDATTTQTITVSSPGVYGVDVVDNNGCIGSASVTITESTSLSPVITGNNAFCENGSTTLNAGSGFDTYLWSDGSANQTLIVSTTGTYAVTVSDAQGCSGETSISISEVLPPVALLQTSATLCNTQAGGSVINLYDLILSGDSSGSWQDADQSGAVGLFNNLNFNNVAAGDYLFVYTTNSAISPCPESVYQVTVTVNECTCPDVLFFNASPLCNAGDQLDLTSIENTTETGTWSLLQTPAGSNPATLIGTLFDATGGDPGEYIFQFVLQNQPPPGCPIDFQASAYVDPAVDAGVAGQPVDYCFSEDHTINLITLITGADPNGIWSETSTIQSQGGAFNPLAGTFQTKTQLSGLYTFQYTLIANGACPDDATEVTVEINPLPTVEVDDFVALDCTNPVQSLDAAGSSDGPEYDIVWTGPGIITDGNENTLHPMIDQQGTYTLTITNTLTGCVNSGIVTVVANTDPPTGALLIDQGPSCFGDQNGMITIDQVTGGTPPILSSLDNSPFSSAVTYNNLSAGSHTLVFSDVNGCRWDTILQLAAPAEISIDLGMDIELGLGESGMVQAIVNLAANEIDTVIWSPSNIIQCIDVVCLEANIFPANTVTLSATVYDVNGCQVSDDIIVLVDKERKVFIPTVFSPNGDGNNDVFFIMGKDNQIVNIKKFAIFNRWGNLVHEDTDILPNDPDMGWDGLFNNEELNPGVFVYTAEIEFVDGLVQVYTGDVTLVR